MMLRRNGYDTESVNAMMQGCVAMGMACSGECARRAEMHDHCRVCASACDRMVETCRSMMSSMPMGS
jgi:hypothetical protein